MSTFVMHGFDAIAYSRKLQDAGLEQRIAEVQAQEMNYALNNVMEDTIHTLESKEIAKKGDIRESELRLQKEIKDVDLKLNNLEIKLKNLEIKLITMYGGGFLIMFSMLAKSLHWF